MKENTFLFSLLPFVVEILLRESARLKTVKSRFCNPEFRSVLHRHCGGRIKQKQTIFLPALDTSYLITKIVKLNNFFKIFDKMAV